MSVKLEVMNSLCALREFEINGVDADYEDFGDKEDKGRENAEEYGCGNMQFTIHEPTQRVLEKYSISTEKYYEIADRLKSGLSFGECGWCV